MMEGSKKRKFEEGDNNEEKCNDLRCDVANIKVIVGGKQQQQGEEKEEGEGKEGRKIFWHYSHILASQSRYIDALLSAPLVAATVTASTNKDIDFDDVRINNITEISFPDITPSQWERMINYHDPVAARKMSVDDAIDLVILYDKYDFHTGIKLCDEVLSSIFYKNEDEFKSHMMNNIELLDQCVNVVVLSHEKSLTQSLEKGLNWLHQLFCWDYTPECLILTEYQIRKLVPVIVCYKDDTEHQNIEDSIKYRMSAPIDISNPVFPAFFVSQIQLIVARRTALKLVNRIRISSCGQGAGFYKVDTDHDVDINGTCVYYHEDEGDETSINLQKDDIGDWIIRTYDDTLLYICNGSRCESLPPKTGWKRIYSADTLNQTNLPIISYFHDNATTGDITKVKI